MNYEEFIKNAYVETELETPVGKIVVSKERSLHNAIRQKYSKMGYEAADAFAEKYYEYTSCDDIIMRAIPDFKASIAFVIEDIKTTLISKDEYDWDDATIFELAVDEGVFNSFYENFMEIKAQIAEIAGDLESAREYREARKDSRGRWVGGTFGGSMLDAIGDQAEIAAMNLATGAIHGLVNMAGNAISEREAKAKLKALLESRTTINRLGNGVLQSVFTLRNIFMKLVIKDEYTCEVRDSADVEKARCLINNLNSGTIPEEKIVEICKQALELDPYNDDVYEYMFKKFGDDGKLSEVAEYFSINSLKNIKDMTAYQYFIDNMGETEETAIEAKEKLLKYCEKNHLEISDDLKSIAAANELLENYDLEYRTVAGIECSTREAADFARKEFEEIKKVLDEIKPLSGDPLLPYERDLLQKKEYITNNFSSEIVPACIAVMDKHLENFNKAFCDTQVIGTADRTKAAKSRALRYARNVKFATEEEYELEYQKFAEFIEENLGITISEAEDARLYLERKKLKIGKEGIDLGGIASDVTSGIKDIGTGLKGLFGKRK